MKLSERLPDSRSHFLQRDYVQPPYTERFRPDHMAMPFNDEHWPHAAQSFDHEHQDVPVPYVHSGASHEISTYPTPPGSMHSTTPADTPHAPYNVTQGFDGGRAQGFGSQVEPSYTPSQYYEGPFAYTTNYGNHDMDQPHYNTNTFGSQEQHGHADV